MKVSRQVRSGDFWARHIDGWRDSGVSQRDYCSRNGLVLSTFTLWKKRLSASRTPTREACVPVEIVPVRLQFPSEGTPIVVWLVTDRGYRLEVRDGFNQETLQKVVKALRDC